MALGILEIIYVVLGISAVAFQYLLYKEKDVANINVYIINVALGLILAYMAFTALPANFTARRTLAIALGVLAIIALLIKDRTKDNSLISKTLLTIAIVGSMIQLIV